MAHYPSVNPSQLRDLMAEHFALDELRSLCMDLGIAYDNMSGDTKREKIISLIEYLQHHRRLDALLLWLQEQRAEVDWAVVYHEGPTSLEPEKFGSKAAPRRFSSIGYKIAGAAALVLLLLFIAYWVVVQTGCRCAYRGEDDYETIVQIIKAESLAVNSSNLTVITDIFALDAYIKQTDNQAGSITEWFDPISHYRPLFETTEFSGALHTDISGTVSGNSARFTSGSQGSYVKNGVYGEYEHAADDPNEHEVWTLEKNFWGCWHITRFEFH